MPHDLVTTNLEVSKTDGAPDAVLQTRYEAPAGPNAEVAEDPYAEADALLAQRSMEWLRSRYSGHLWCVISDLAQGIVKFNIPILMGVNNFWIINLRTTSMADGLVEGAGQILERYNLRRGRIDVAAFLEAREKHSILVNRFRKVPN